MQKTLTIKALEIATSIQAEAVGLGLIGIEEPTRPKIQIIPEGLVSDCPPYLKRIVREINGTYESAFFTSCAVMIRRLLETSIIEVYSKNGLDSEIRNSDGNFFGIADLRRALLTDPFKSLSRISRRALKNDFLFECGHLAAHDRFYTARKQDIERICNDARVLFEYLTHH